MVEIVLTVLGLIVLVAWGVLWTVMSAALVLFEPKPTISPRLALFRKWPIDSQPRADGARQAHQN